MDYEQLQADAKSENRNLLFAFAAIIAVVAAAAAAVITAVSLVVVRVLEAYIVVDASSTGRVVEDSELVSGRAPLGWIYFSVFVVVAGVIVWVSHSRERALIAFGGAGIARSMGGRRVEAVTGDSAERRFVNAVEEMAIAANQPAPSVYILDHERSINVFNAGWTPETTVVGITGGALTELSRVELQAVAAQAMSHVFHGDARLNLRLMALVTGVAGLAMIGEDWIERAQPESRDDRQGVFLPLFVAGCLLYAVGWIGVALSSGVQRSVARRHELLADATAIELLRQMSPMRDALRRIGGHPSRGRIRHRKARSTNHLFMVDAGNRRRRGVHPDLRLRVLRLDPSWNGDWVRPDTADVFSPDGPAPAPGEPSSPLLSVASSIGSIPALEPLAPAFDAMTAPVAGLTGALDANPRLGTEILAPVMTAAVLDQTDSAAPGPDAEQARCMVVSLVHLATEQSPSNTSVPKPCDPEQVAVMLDALKRAGAFDSQAIDRPAMLADAGQVLRGRANTASFARDAVAGLRSSSDLDQWILGRLILGNLIEPTEPKKSRSLERLRPHYATVLSTLVAIGGGNLQAAFDVAVSRADLLGLHRRRPGKLGNLDKSLDKLAGLEPQDHDRCLSGLMGAVHADGDARRTELEFVEVVRIALRRPDQTGVAEGPPGLGRGDLG